MQQVMGRVDNADTHTLSTGMIPATYGIHSETGIVSITGQKMKLRIGDAITVHVCGCDFIVQVQIEGSFGDREWIDCAGVYDLLLDFLPELEIQFLGVSA